MLRQFDEAISVADAREPAEWQRETCELQSLRSELDGYVRELHREFPNGLSAYRCFAWLLNHPEDQDFTWALSNATNQSREDLDHLRDVILELSSALSRAQPNVRGALAWIADPNALAAARRLPALALKRTLRHSDAPWNCPRYLRSGTAPPSPR